MKISTKQARNFRPSIGKLATAFALASAMGGMSIAPAFGYDRDDYRGDHRDHREWRDHRGHDWDHDRGYHRGWRERGGPAYYESPRPVYAPVPVYVAPPRSPGVSIFLPLDIRVR